MGGEGSLVMSRLNPMQSPSTSDLDGDDGDGAEDLEEAEYMTAYEGDGGRSFMGGDGRPMSEYSNPMMVSEPPLR